jgi:RNA polymerase sigma factor (TIGR02999 family)
MATMCIGTSTPHPRTDLGYPAVERTRKVMGSEDRGPAGDLTQLLERMSAGDEEAGRELWARLYPELRQRARQAARGAPNHSLQPTELIGHAYERMCRLRGKQWTDRDHFLAVAALSMHWTLVDYARRKRRRDALRADLEEALVAVEDRVGDLLRFEEAVEKLDAVDPPMGKALRLRCLGYDQREVAAMLGISRRTLDRSFARARAWVHRLLS